MVKTHTWLTTNSFSAWDGNWRYTNPHISRYWKDRFLRKALLKNLGRIFIIFHIHVMKKRSLIFQSESATRSFSIDAQCLLICWAHKRYLDLGKWIPIEYSTILEDSLYCIDIMINSFSIPPTMNRSLLGCLVVQLLELLTIYAVQMSCFLPWKLTFWFCRGGNFIRKWSIWWW